MTQDAPLTDEERGAVDWARAYSDGRETGHKLAMRQLLAIIDRLTFASIADSGVHNAALEEAATICDEMYDPYEHDINLGPMIRALKSAPPKQGGGDETAI